MDSWSPREANVTWIGFGSSPTRVELSARRDGMHRPWAVSGSSCLAPLGGEAKQSSGTHMANPGFAARPRGFRAAPDLFRGGCGVWVMQGSTSWRLDLRHFGIRRERSAAPMMGSATSWKAGILSTSTSHSSPQLLAVGQIPARPGEVQTPNRRARSVCKSRSGSHFCFWERNLATASWPCTRANEDSCSTASLA